MNNQNAKQLNKTKGAALIIAVLVVAAVAGITFYAGRLSIREIVVTSKLEDSIDAYYIAEAGIEQGLLMWRNNHDVEYSQEYMQSSTSHPSVSSGTPIEVLIDPSSSTSTVKKYQLKIYHRKNTSENVTNTLGKDETAEYDLSNFPNDTTLSISCTIGCGSTIDNALEYTVYKNRDILSKNMLYNNNVTQNITTDNSNTEKLKIRSWGQSHTYTLSISGGTAYNLDDNTLTIESTGIFNNTQRKIRVIIDRNTGKVLNSFDFVLFGGTEIAIASTPSSTSTPTPTPTPAGYGPNVTSTAYTIYGGTQYSTQVASNAFDHVAESCSAGDSCFASIQSSASTYIGQDFGSSPKNIRQVRVYKSSSFSFNSTLQYSDNGTSWNSTNVVVIYPKNTNTWQEYSVNNYGAHRYWRFLDAQDDGYMQIVEVEMKEAL
jgi:hypothetical protein